MEVQMEAVPFQTLHDQYSRDRVFKWTLRDGQVGAPAILPSNSTATFQATGNFGTGGVVTLMGSIVPGVKPEDSAWFIMHDPFYNLIRFTSRDGCDVQETASSYSPIVTAGAGVEVDVYLLVVTGGQ